MRLDAAIADAMERLSSNSDSPRLDAEILLCRTIDVPRSYLMAHPDDELDELAIMRFERLLGRRLDGEPMAYITGRKEFWTHELHVSPATLVPRPETELLVELALREIPQQADWHVVDFGTGSGAIAIAIASERPLSSIVATDISDSALAVARENVRSAALPNVECVAGDWTGAVAGQRFDLIVSNPPYVRYDDEALENLRHEPVSALVSGSDGLDAIRVLARDGADVLRRRGAMLLEHGADQQDAVAAVLRDNGWVDVVCHQDLAGRPRVTAARQGDKQAPCSELDEPQ